MRGIHATPIVRCRGIQHDNIFACQQPWPAHRSVGLFSTQSSARQFLLSSATRLGMGALLRNLGSLPDANLVSLSSGSSIGQLATSI